MVAHVDAVRDLDDDQFAGVTESAPAARTAAAPPALPSPSPAGVGALAELGRVSPGELVSLQDRERVERYQAGASSPNTVRAYRHDWSELTGWCAEHAYTPASPVPTDGTAW